MRRPDPRRPTARPVAPARRSTSATARPSLAALVALALAGLGPACGRPAGPPPPVRITYLPIYVSLPLFVAADRGLFARHGVEVELIELATSPLQGTALVTGKTDVAISISYAVALAIESRDPGLFRVFVVDAETPENPLSAMVAMPGSRIARVEDLRGKTVASFPGPTALTFFGLVMKKHGVDPASDARVTELAPALHCQALASGQVDALNTYEPIATQCVLEHGAVKFFPGAIETDIISPWQAGVSLVSTRLLRDRPEDARKVIAAIHEAIEYLRAHPGQAKQSLGRHTRLADRVVAALPSIPFTRAGAAGAGREIDLAAFQRHADLLHQAGVVSRPIAAAPLLLGPGLESTTP